MYNKFKSFLPNKYLIHFLERETLILKGVTQ